VAYHGLDHVAFHSGAVPVQVDSTIFSFTAHTLHAHAAFRVPRGGNCMAS